MEQQPSAISDAATAAFVPSAAAVDRGRTAGSMLTQPVQSIAAGSGIYRRMRWLAGREHRRDIAAVTAFHHLAELAASPLSTDQPQPEGRGGPAGCTLDDLRAQLDRCEAGEPEGAFFQTLREVISRRQLAMSEFRSMLEGFAYWAGTPMPATWQELAENCRATLGPLGRLLVAATSVGKQPSETVVQRLDELYTAIEVTRRLQRINHDIVKFGRIWLPADLMKSQDTATRLKATASQGYGVDQSILQESREIVRTCAERTWPLLERGGGAVDELAGRSRAVTLVTGRFYASVLRTIEQWNFEVLLMRPQPGPVQRLAIITGAWWSSRTR